MYIVWWWLYGCGGGDCGGGAGAGGAGGAGVGGAGGGGSGWQERNHYNQF